ncbi:hypothetical protein [Aeromicrobium sp. UC242_57]|uniref:hypothetical protein n=1 Tax=Aeromicrobium sp. UC242_57 TaxID=3374624 RepID=UPI0037A184DD
MRSLAAEYGTHCLVSAAMGDWIVVLSAVGNPTRIRTTFREGQRGSPLTPPMGSLFVAWRDQAEIDHWITQAHTAVDPIETAIHLSALEDIRSHGFAVAQRLDAKRQLELALTEFASNTVGVQEPREAINALLQQMRNTTYLVVDHGDDTLHQVDWIGVPLFDRSHQVELALVMTNFPDDLSGAQIKQVADRLQAAANAVRPQPPATKAD